MENQKSEYPHIVLTTPFANKEYCFDKYYKSVINLDYPKDKLSALWYDNSNSESFASLLNEKIKVFPKHGIITDTTPNYTIENTSDYAQISKRCHMIYKRISQVLPTGYDYMFNVEDDVEIPPDSLLKMLRIFKEHSKVGTVIGSVSGRRLNDRAFKLPVVWFFEQRKIFPYVDSYKKYHTECHRYKGIPPFGIQIVGTGHMGLWLTKIDLIKQVGFQWEEDNLTANDIVWGYRLGKAGYYTVIDWSIIGKHWWKIKDEIGYY